VLTLEQIKKIMKMEEMYGSNEGSCFGVTDSSRLRPPMNIKLNEKRKTNKEGPVADMTPYMKIKKRKSPP
jgi:hypothetical protein